MYHFCEKLKCEYVLKKQIHVMTWIHAEGAACDVHGILVSVPRTC